MEKPATKNTIEFSSLQEHHIPLLRKWLKEPHVAEFWQETEDEEKFRDKFLGKLPERGVSAFVILVDSKLIGYIQYYDACKVGGGWWPDAEEGTFGIDQFIGDPDMVGKGLGTEIIKRFVENIFLLSKVSQIITDPEPMNKRAIRAYEKVGFKSIGEIKTPGGAALLMRLKRIDLSTDFQKHTTIETFLQNFHKKHPGCTPASFSNGFTQEGMTSYDVALSVVTTKPEVPITVADLACGDGVLLQKLANRNLGSISLIGIDMSAGELEAARARLGKLPVKLIEAKAQEIPLPDQSVDFVLCHMAFMLMDNVEEVVSEISRILKNDGVFCAIVGGKHEKTPAMEAFLSLLDEALKDENKSWLSNLGDRRTRSEEGLRSLFSSSQFFQPIKIHDFTIQFHEKPADLMDFFMLMYDVGTLSPQRESSLGKALAEKLNLLTNESGKMTHSMGLRQVICKKAGPR